MFVPLSPSINLFKTWQNQQVDPSLHMDFIQLFFHLIFGTMEPQLDSLTSKQSNLPPTRQLYFSTLLSAVCPCCLPTVVCSLTSNQTVWPTTRKLQLSILLSAVSTRLSAVWPPTRQLDMSYSILWVDSSLFLNIKVPEKKFEILIWCCLLQWKLICWKSQQNRYTFFYLPTVYYLQEGCGIKLFQMARTAILDGRCVSILYPQPTLSKKNRFIRLIVVDLQA